MAKHPFDKFMGNEPKGAKKKEILKAQKRKAKKASQEIGEQKRREKWEKERGINPETKPFIAGKKQDNLSEKKTRTIKRPINSHNSQNEEPVTAKTSTSTKEGASPEKKFSKKYVTSNSDKYFKGDAHLDPSLTKKPKKEGEEAEDEMPLNKYVAHAGVCGRREAAEMVKQGLVTVNGDVVFEPGYKVLASDEVSLKGQKLFLKKNLVYLLLNKPKDYITTSNDPEGRKTVMDLIKDATKERVYPVGRLDRNTTGVLLLTNDGELAQKLTHPGYQIKKVYAAKLDKPLTKRHFENILTGITLEDGTIQADSLAYADSKDKTQIGIEIHSGKNRIVRRIFEHLGYEVKTLDRVMFANLTKKNVERSHWRFLLEKEVRLLKYLNQSFIKKDKPTTEIPNLED